MCCWPQLNWVLTEGRATLRCRTLTHGNKDFDVTTLQAIALLCFNEKPSMTFGEICNEMGMAESDEGKYVMKRVLHPLSCAKDHDILVKTPKYGRFLGVVMVCVRVAPCAHLSLADVQEQEYR